MRVRDLVETGLLLSGIPRMAAHRRRGHTLVLSYHNIVPDDGRATGDRSLHLGQSMFGRQLDVLVETCEVIPLALAVEPTASHSRPRVAITFDDAYCGALALGRAELTARGLPATMFVPPGLLGTDAFWWDAYADAGGLSPSFREQALGPLRGNGDAVRRYSEGFGRAPAEMPSWCRPGREADVMNWVDGSKLTVGSHTWSHQNLVALTDAERDVELESAARWLHDRFHTSALPWLTYPYGLATSAVAAAARATGYAAALVVAGGWFDHSAHDAMLLPRLNIPAGLSIAGFRLRLAGLIGTAAA